MVTDVADGALLWGRVLDFFEGSLGLLAREGAEGGGGDVTRRDLQVILVLIVGR